MWGRTAGGCVTVGPRVSQPSLMVLSGCRHATGKAQHGNFLVAIKQEKGESARVGGEKPEEEVSPRAHVPSHTIPESGAQGSWAGAVPAPLFALHQPTWVCGCGHGPRKGSAFALGAAPVSH